MKLSGMKLSVLVRILPESVDDLAEAIPTGPECENRESDSA